jgi:iron complex outermembrane receptor protein
MRKMLLKHAFYIMAMLFSTAMLAQVTVTGVVSDQMGPLPGVNVLEKGTQNGTVTGFDGDYSLEVAEGATLVFSYVGFKTKEINIGDQTTIDVTLEEDAAKLDEVIVVGYGSTTKQDRTGAVETVSAEDFNKGVQTNATDLLQGRTAGIQITAAGGEPGGSTDVRIRGAASLRGDNNPLYVVDGMLIGGDSSAGSADVGLGNTPNKNPLNFINPSDIENISILKDASATAIYGARGANGVIIITTKKGKFGEPTVSYNAFFGAAEVANPLDILTGQQYRNALASDGGNPDNDFGANVDAFDAITRTALVSNHSLSFIGGDEKSKYRYSLSALDQEGVVEGTGIQNYTASLSNSYRFLKDDRLKVDANLIASYVRDDRELITNNADFEGNLIGTALFWNPTLPLFNDDGTYRQPPPGFSDSTGTADTRNPLAVLDYTEISSETSRIVGNLAARFDITSDLEYKFNIGVDRAESNNRTSASRDFATDRIFGRGEAVNANRTAFTYLIEHTLNYQKEFGDDFKVNALAGYAFQEITGRGFSAEGRNISFDPGDENDNLGGFTERFVSSFEQPTELLESWFGRAIFDAYGKYTLTATFRADGSNKFGVNNQWGYFPAFAAAWKIHEEDFAPDFFDQLKLRASWGQSGNQNFPAGASRGRRNVGTATTEDEVSTVVNEPTAPNPDLKWEVNETVNIGVDFAFLDNRISGSIDVFRRDTQDLLILQEPIQPAPRDTFIWQNIDGNTINTGLELGIFADVVNTEDWSFTFSGNVSFLQNELRNFDGAIDVGPISGPGLTGAFAQRIEGGQPVNSFYLAEFAGFDDSGVPQYFTADGGLTPNASTEAERRYLGDPNPNMLIGLNFNVRYKNIDLSANLNGAYGHQLFNNTALVLNKNNLNANRNTLIDNIGNGETPGPAAVSSRYMESGDFLRLNNLTLGYNFDNENLPDFIKNLRVFATGQNLFVITPYSGFDPEVNTGNTLNNIPSFGLDYLVYPRARTFTVGLSAMF